MTLDKEVEQHPNDDTQQKQEPFKIVLIDIEKAAHDNTIHCVEVPLEGAEGLEYVALSYRWGELHEMMVDTHVGYTAYITSFDLDDFYRLCYMMTCESDLKSIKYVWVDAICVDQIDHERRKATIYHMTRIYEHAAYIVAVPDLHLAHLKSTMTKNEDIIDGSRRYSNDIYHLIHGNTDELAAIEEKFLDKAKVPNDPVLRHWLTKYTDYFMDGFMNYKDHVFGYHPVEALDHIYETSQPPSSSAHSLRMNDDDCSKPKINLIKATDPSSIHGAWNHCNKFYCPLHFFDLRSTIDWMDSGGTHVGERCDDNLYVPPNNRWKRLVPERSTAIR
ncbi:unnamed protein product [Absidia cylindrospora]